MRRRLAKAVRERHDGLRVAISLVPLISLFIPWFEIGGGVCFLAFCPDVEDASLTGWEAFSWQDITLAVVALGLAAAAVLHRGSTHCRLWPVGLAVFGGALAVTMIGDLPVRQSGLGPYAYEPTHLGWVAVAGFAVAAITFGLRWGRSPGRTEQP